jgi:1-aminocyclopropane-1-carboxylate deaminase/D-cysteine desulfhydrase-like pyridoxal-dependent ACC family enzyme
VIKNLLILKMNQKKAYVIPRGGSNSVAAWSYIAAWEEMLNQPVFDEITDVVVVSGSGGTGVDLAIANYCQAYLMSQ